MEQLLCPWESAQYFIYSSNIPTLFFYSHLPAILVALLVGLLVFYKSGKSKIGISLLIVSVLFSFWSVFDLILWATNRPDIVMFFWSLQILFEPLIYLLCFYLVYLFIENKDLFFSGKIFLILLYFPIVLLLSSNYNLQGVHLADCTAVEGFIAQYFTYFLEVIIILSIVLLVALECRKSSIYNRKKEVITFGLGVILFLIAFSSGNVIGSFTENWNLAQAGLIGMPIFVGFLAYMIVKFKTFNIKVIGTQVLVFALGFLVFAVLFIRRIENVRIVIIFTLLFVVALGYALVKSVKKEIEQREQLAKLNTSLRDLIKQRESLVHLITHKVKGSFTRTKYIFSGLLDGTFGEISPEVKKIAGQGLEFDNSGIQTVDLVLNVANLQNGLIKYDMKKVDFKNIVLETINDKKLGAEAKGLKLETEIKPASPAGGDGIYNLTGDAFWLKEVVNNLISNSITYTKEGKIIVGLEKRPARNASGIADAGGNDKILFFVKDTGMGINEEDKKNLFTEGGRGKDSARVNVDSTGYGLFTVKIVVTEHKGKVWAESEGAGKGSTFFVELPAIS